MLEKARTTVDVTPRFEIFYALQELERGAGARLANWRREMERRLPARSRTEIARVAPCPLMWPLLADSLRDEPARISFTQILSALRSMDRAQFQRNVLTGVFKADGAVDGLMTGRVSLKRTIAQESEGRQKLFALLGLSPFDAEASSTHAFERIISQPDTYRDEVANAIEMFWQIGFNETWTKLEPQMHSSLRAMKSAITRRGFEAFAIEHQLPVKVTPTTLGIHVIPSAFNISKLWASYTDSHERTQLFVPVVDHTLVVETPLARERVRQKQREEERSEPVTDPSLVFKALGDTTRYAIATTLARTPMTSVELSRVFKVSKPTISHHVQHLRAADLLIEKQGENGTILSLNKRVLEHASARAATEMFSEEGPDHVVQRSRKSNRRQK